MFEKRKSSFMFALLGSLVLSGGLAHGAVLYTNTVSLLSTDPTQLGRLSRNGVPQDWSGQEPFPGVINYRYDVSL